MTPKRPIMRYHGGKWMMAPRILPFFPPHTLYAEPFGGAGSLLMRKEPKAGIGEIYNDIDGDVVNVFRVLRDPHLAERLRELIALTPWARDEFVLSYEPSADPVEQARRTLARAMMAHGGTSRLRHRSGFRAKLFEKNSTGPVDWVNWPDAVPAIIDRLKYVVIENRNALELIRQQDKGGALFYCDPPYVHSSRSSMRHDAFKERAYAQEMSDDDHAELAGLLGSIEGMALVSGYPSALYDRIYDGWRCERFETFADGGIPRIECLWISPNAQAALHRAAIALAADRAPQLALMG